MLLISVTLFHVNAIRCWQSVSFREFLALGYCTLALSCEKKVDAMAVHQLNYSVFFDPCNTS